MHNSLNGYIIGILLLQAIKSMTIVHTMVDNKKYLVTNGF